MTGFNPTLSGGITAQMIDGQGGPHPENISNLSAISPINTRQNRSFKYRAKQVPVAATKGRTGKNKSTSRGRGAVVANSTQLVGPVNRK